MLSGADISNRSQPSGAALGIITRELDPRTSIITVGGEIDLARAPSFKGAMYDALESGHDQLVVDLSPTIFMDSTALGVLVGVNRSLEVGARMAIACARPNLLKIFELSGIDGTFAIFPTLDEALAHARGHAAQSS
jgi:anti-sigma B factor antagonist